MSTDPESGSVSGVRGSDVAIEPRSVPEQVVAQLRRRWKTVGTIAVTAATTAAVHRIDGGWSTDATAFALVTVLLAGYTLATLYSDLEFE